MNRIYQRLLPSFGMLILLLSTSFAARASCGLAGGRAHPVSMTLPHGTPGSLLAISDADDATPSIVGMWHVKFIAERNAEGPPDGTLIDNALVVWHSDHTEIMNSARPPQDGDFCLGVWEEVGTRTYKLNHFAWLANDTANAPGGIGKPSGPTRIRQTVTLSPDGHTFRGTFSLDAYDTSGNNVTHIGGDVIATRVTLGTGTGDLLK